MSDWTAPQVYYLISKGLASVIDLAGGNRADGTKVLNWEKGNKKSNQLWQISHAGDGEYLLLSVATGTYITAPDGGNGQATGNLVSPTNKRARWKIVPAKNGAYILYSVAYPNKVLDVKGANKDNGTPIILWDYHKGDNQEWLIKLPE